MKRAALVIAGVAALLAAWWLTRPSEVAPATGTTTPEPAASAPSSTRPSERSLSRDSSAAPDDEIEAAIPTTTVAATVDRSPPKACALAMGTDAQCPFLDPDEDMLQELARCGIARFDTPRLFVAGEDARYFPDEWLAKAGVGAAEHEQLEQATAAFMAEQGKKWTELAAGLGIDREWSDGATPSVVYIRIASEFDGDQVASAVENVARERAGMEPIGDEVPAALDAAVRMRADTGEAYETALAKVVGEQRAAELRAAADGWPGGRSWIGNRCDSAPTPPPPQRLVPGNAKEAEACVDDMKGKGCAFLDPTPHELDRMADCGVVRIELPAFVGDRLSDPTFDMDPTWADEVGLTPQEAAVMAEVGEQIREDFYRDLMALVLEAGKTQEWADQTPFVGLLVAVGEASGLTEAQREEMIRRIANERAGRVPAPADLSQLSLEDRFTRRLLTLSDDLEQALVERLGAERARALRHARDGWPGIRNQTKNLCNGGEAQFF